MKPLFLALFLCFFIEKSQSQQAIEDIDRDLDKFNSLILSKPPEAHFFLKRAIKKSENINSDSLQSKVLCNLGYYYYQTNQSDSSKNVFERSLLLSKKVKYYRMLGYAYNQLGLIAVDKGDYQKAISLHLGALKIASAHHIAKMKSNALNNLGNVFLIQKDTVKALEYYHQNIINALENNLENQLTNGYMTIANLNIYSNPSKANIFYSKALILARKNKDLKTQLTIEICKTNMSLKSKKSLQKAYYHIQKSIAIENELKDASLLYYIDINLGDYYYYLKQYSLAEINYLKAENNFDKGVDLHIKLSLYNSLSKLYESKKDFEKSLSYKEKYRE